MSLPLQHSPADVSRAVLVLAGAGTDPSVNAAWPIYTAGEPSSPDSVITVFDTAPRGDGRTLKDGEQLYHFGIQVRIRALDHPSGFAKAYTIKQIMDEQVENVNLYNYLATPYSYFFHCFTNTNLLYLGKEVPSSRRSLFTINCYATMKRIQ